MLWFPNKILNVVVSSSISPASLTDAGWVVFVGLVLMGSYRDSDESTIFVGSLGALI